MAGNRGKGKAQCGAKSQRGAKCKTIAPRDVSGKASRSIEEEREDGEEKEELSAMEDDAQDSDGSTSTTASNATGKRQTQGSYNFQSSVEQRFVEFFEAHDCFYNKASEQYSNSMFKNRLLKDLAKDCNTDAQKILGWFKNQRTARWQLSSFNFLKTYIVPRSYTQDTAELPVGEKEEEEEEEEVAGEGDPEEAEAGSSASTHKTVSVASVKTSARGLKRCWTPKLDEALIKFLSKPRDSETVAKKIQDLDDDGDERHAFGKWMCSCFNKVPEDRWDDFQEEAFSLINRYTRPFRPPTSTSTCNISLGRTSTSASTTVPSESVPQPKPSELHPHEQLAQQFLWFHPQVLQQHQTQLTLQEPQQQQQQQLYLQQPLQPQQSWSLGQPLHSQHLAKQYGPEFMQQASNPSMLPINTKQPSSHQQLQQSTISRSASTGQFHQLHNNQRDADSNAPRSNSTPILPGNDLVHQPLGSLSLWAGDFSLPTGSDVSTCSQSQKVQERNQTEETKLSTPTRQPADCDSN
ncbi:uncharacterized protein LOC132871958 [Neoarius graeffei]|uniref:uncharacterized protein LOC132871958 n=1 Tax=Neoarius graeffei TaxID=443677 RepID=UPI00298CC9BD|nr:uncharacterized protein LOC132871958 [Neoarius graeffei]